MRRGLRMFWVSRWSLAHTRRRSSARPQSVNIDWSSILGGSSGSTTGPSGCADPDWGDRRGHWPQWPVGIDIYSDCKTFINLTNPLCMFVSRGQRLHGLRLFTGTWSFFNTTALGSGGYQSRTCFQIFQSQTDLYEHVYNVFVGNTVWPGQEALLLSGPRLGPVPKQQPSGIGPI